SQIPFEERVSDRALGEDAELRNRDVAAKSIDQDADDFVGDVGFPGEQRVELLMAEREQPHRSIGAGGRGTGPPVDEGDLAKELARPESGQTLSVPGDGDMPAKDDEELVSGLALTKELVAVGQIDQVGDPAQSVELLSAEAREERHPPQHLELVTGGH